MIDVNRIRNLATLEDIKVTLNEFLSHADIPKIYVEQYEWGLEDYEADREMAEELLEKVERRMKSLSNHLIKAQAKRQDLPARPQTGSTEIPSGP